MTRQGKNPWLCRITKDHEMTNYNKIENTLFGAVLVGGFMAIMIASQAII
jgi:hypothetical protein